MRIFAYVLLAFDLHICWIGNWVFKTQRLSLKPITIPLLDLFLQCIGSKLRLCWNRSPSPPHRAPLRHYAPVNLPVHLNPVQVASARFFSWRICDRVASCCLFLMKTDAVRFLFPNSSCFFFFVCFFFLRFCWFFRGVFACWEIGFIFLRFFSVSFFFWGIWL